MTGPGKDVQENPRRIPDRRMRPRMALRQVNRQEETPPPSDVYRGRRDVHVEPLGHQDSATAVMHATNAFGYRQDRGVLQYRGVRGRIGLGMEKFSEPRTRGHGPSQRLGASSSSSNPSGIPAFHRCPPLGTVRANAGRLTLRPLKRDLQGANKQRFSITRRVAHRRGIRGPRTAAPRESQPFPIAQLRRAARAPVCP